MSRFEVAISLADDEPREPSTIMLLARFTNVAEEPASIDASQIEHPSIVLQVRDRHGRQVLLPPPHAPGDKDEIRVVEPGGTIELRYAGFLDRDLPEGSYQVRYFGAYEPVGADADGPLQSAWLALEVGSSRRRFTMGSPIPPAEPSAYRAARGFIDSILCLIVFAIRALACAFRRLIDILFSIFGGNRRCRESHEQEVDVQRTETITDAPPGSEAWNGTYGWRARFHVRVDEAACSATVTLRIRTAGNVSDAQRLAWEGAIEAVWNDKFKLCCHDCCCLNGFEIALDIRWVDSDEHQVVNAQDSTTNMNNWGRNDTVDVAHEVGHMLAALDEYFTVNGVAWGPGRQADGAIMNNPGNEPAARHYDAVRSSVAGLLGSSCSTVRVGRLCC